MSEQEKRRCVQRIEFLENSFPALRTPVAAEVKQTDLQEIYRRLHFVEFQAGVLKEARDARHK
jgi:hypothetical protein